MFVRLRECVCVCELTYVRMCVHNHLLFLSACMNIIQITAEAPQSQKCERTLTENMKIITVVGHVGSKKSNIKRSNQKIHFHRDDKSLEEIKWGFFQIKNDSEIRRKSTNI